MTPLNKKMLADQRRSLSGNPHCGRLKEGRKKVRFVFLTPTQRRKVSERMKAYHARKRAEKHD